MSIVKTLTSWNNYYKTTRALNRLSAHELSDIGLTRGEVKSAARRFA